MTTLHERLRIMAEDDVLEIGRREPHLFDFNDAKKWAGIMNEAADRIEKLDALTTGSVTVGGGMEVYGSVEALMRVQDYILINSNHPIEKEDVRRSLARALQAAETRAKELEEALKPFSALAVEFMDDGDMRSKADDRTVWGLNDHDLTYGDFRRARETVMRAKP